ITLRAFWINRPRVGIHDNGLLTACSSGQKASGVQRSGLKHVHWAVSCHRTDSTYFFVCFISASGEPTP
ncbi:MAG: hypothetical protein ACPG4A_05530, partial [Pseudomonadales bacterium]